MSKHSNKRNRKPPIPLGQRLHDLLAELDRLLNPPQPTPVRVPARGRRR
jgi:hypothetical protein